MRVDPGTITISNPIRDLEKKRNPMKMISLESRSNIKSGIPVVIADILGTLVALDLMSENTGAHIGGTNASEAMPNMMHMGAANAVTAEEAAMIAVTAAASGVDAISTVGRKIKSTNTIKGDVTAIVNRIEIAIDMKDGLTKDIATINKAVKDKLER